MKNIIQAGTSPLRLSSISLSADLQGFDPA
jgi:hypothetical protein